MTKREVRRLMKRRLNAQPKEERLRKSLLIWRKLTRLAAFRRAAWVCTYVALPYEVQTWQMIEKMLEAGKRVVVPWVLSTGELALCEIREPLADLAPGAFGVLEPVVRNRKSVALDQLDLVLVPGLAFDAQGHRLGHGKGYYDRLLAKLPDGVPTVGLGYDFQLLKRLPAEPHDRAVTRVLTN
jgi:5-formyltetrahydrofolate cyclo-ligase